MSRTMVQRATGLLDRPVSRRGFLSKMTMGATALSVAPMKFLFRQGSAYSVICTCSGQTCGCGDLCCDGYTDFCCATHGENVCPSGTVPAGWWKADGSGICDTTSGPQPRYYLDCNVSDCGPCGCGSKGICEGDCQDPLNFVCGCGTGDCTHRKSSCTGFRYGQCNQATTCVGPIVCRVVTCTPPWIWDDSCTMTSATDNATRFHNAPCLEQPTALPSGIPVVGDWTGSGKDTPGVFSNGRWHLKRADGGPNIVFTFGNPGDTPVVGDWTGDGVDTCGVVRRSGEWHLRHSNTTGNADKVFYFGNPGDEPFAGDWNGDGVDTPGQHRRSDGRIYLRNSNTQGNADIWFFFGNPGDRPVIGDANSDGRDTVSLFRPSQRRFYIINRLGTNGGGLGAADYFFSYGNSTDTPVMGDYDDDGTDTIGVYRRGAFYLRNSNSAGLHDIFVP